MLGMRIAQVAAPRPLSAKIANTALRQAVACAGRVGVVMMRSVGGSGAVAGSGIESIRSNRFE